MARASSDWRPTAGLEALKLRAHLLQRVRDFFSARAVLEVETPILSSAASTDPHLESFATTYTGPGFSQGHKLYLHTSPEFAMKRLLAAGSGSIYQIGKVFRNNESGRNHNPEFTMLEWYRVGFDHRQLMDEVRALVEYALAGVTSFEGHETLTYAEAFETHAGLNPHAASLEDFKACAKKYLVHAPEHLADHGLNGWRDLILTHVVEPHLGKTKLTFIYDYPASQAAFARVRPESPPIAERFELYVRGTELANGFHELTDTAEQSTRFRHHLSERKQSNLPVVPMDERLIAALQAGLPHCSGVALGFDRLVMLAAGANTIEEVIAFPVNRA
jgi:lysyl-tRNA synthetase class 2